MGRLPKSQAKLSRDKSPLSHQPNSPKKKLYSLRLSVTVLLLKSKSWNREADWWLILLLPPILESQPFTPTETATSILLKEALFMEITLRLTTSTLILETTIPRAFKFTSEPCVASKKLSRQPVQEIQINLLLLSWNQRESERHNHPDNQDLEEHSLPRISKSKWKDSKFYPKRTKRRTTSPSTSRRLNRTRT